MSLVQKIVSCGLCTGCGLCESVAEKDAIKMQMTTAGYLRPEVIRVLPESTEKAIAAVCPGVAVSHEKSSSHYDIHWGDLRGVHVGHAMDSDVHRMGSSGGVISALCLHLLTTKQVNFIAQIAVSAENPVVNELQISRTREDILRAAGSRYAPSAPLKNLRELLATGEKFAFVGKPCDVAALRAYLRLHPEHQAQVPYLLSFMCAGIPSEKATYDVVKAMGADPEQLASFRYRGDGWPGMAKAVLNNGAVHQMDYNGSWGNILGKQLQFRCKVCADGTGEFADIVCADAWYGKDGYPDFTEREGRSLILVRTQAGEALLQSAVSNADVSTEPLPASDIPLMQPYQLNRKQLAVARGLATWFKQGKTTRFINLKLWQAARGIGFIYALRNAWGTYKRANGETAQFKKVK